MLMKRGVLSVDVADAIAQCLDHRERVHRLPEEMAWIEVDSEIWPKLLDAPEALEVEDVGSRMKLETDHEVRVLAAREGGNRGPVRLHAFTPLPLGDLLEVRQPASTREMRSRPICRRRSWTP